MNRQEIVFKGGRRKNKDKWMIRGHLVGRKGKTKAVLTQRSIQSEGAILTGS